MANMFTSEGGFVIEDRGLCRRSSQLKKTWEHYLTYGRSKANQRMRSPILKSWERCHELNINPLLQRAPDVVSESELETKKDSFYNSSIVGNCFRGIEHLADLSGYMVSVSDAEGCLLNLIGNPNLLSVVSARNFIVGAKWSEFTTGTNAIGTALRIGRTADVFAAEHFCEGWHEYACTTTPVRDPFTRQIVGVIDVTTPFSNYHPNNRKLSEFLSRSIEQEILRAKLDSEQFLVDSYLTALVDQNDPGLILVDHEGYIRQFFLKRFQLLGLGKQDLQGKFLKDVAALRGLDNIAILRGPEYFVLENGLRAKVSPILRGDAYVGSLIDLDFQTPRRSSKYDLSNNMDLTSPIGRSSCFVNILNSAIQVAEVDCNICIGGETGTGKGVLAHFIHHQSPRKDKPFVSVNCGTLPKDLACSELFGYEFGAFTGAKKNGHKGKFEIACGGTIFLDEISELSLEAQAALLHVTEEKHVTPLGSNKPKNIDVRIIVATNKPLKAQVQQGIFRKDLYYRLNVVRIDLPSLRQRTDDIPILAKHFVRVFASNMGKTIADLDAEVMDAIINYEWPGNVRELKNAIEHAVIFCRNSVISIDHLPKEIQCFGSTSARKTDFKTDEGFIRFITAQKACTGNVTKMAKMLKISRPTVYKWGKRYDNQFPERSETR